MINQTDEKNDGDKLTNFLFARNPDFTATNRFTFNCPICGLPMVHSRLRGYHCHNEHHNEQMRDYPESK